MRRANGSVEQLPSGKWRFKITMSDGKRRASPTYESEQEAEAVLEAALEELAAGNVVPVVGMTLRTYGERFLARLTNCTAKEDRARWRLHVEPTDLVDMPIESVKRRHIRDFMDALSRKKKLVAASGEGARSGGKVESDETISPQTQKHMLTLLRRIYNDAKFDDLVDVNPCDGVRVQRADDESEETWHTITLDEIQRLLSHPRLPETKRLIFETALYTGMREGELWALRWRDLTLDVEHPSCSTRRSYKKGTKAGKVRHFPLLPAAVAALRRVRERAKDRSPDALVFPNRQGGQYAKGYDAEWGRWSTAAGLREELRFHDLRHSFASHLVMGSWGRAWSLAEVKDYIGHCSVSMTERYAHLSPGHLKALAAETKIVHAASTPARVAEEVTVAEGPDPRADDPSLRRPLLYPTELRAPKRSGLYQTRLAWTIGTDGA